MLGKDIKQVLATITPESMTSSHECDDLWDKLPDYVAGPAWVGEIVDMSQRASDWLDDEQDYTDTATDIAIHLADGEIEDYYSNINRRVQELSLWAHDEIDSLVNEWFCGEVSPSLTDLNSHYLFCAMHNLAYLILEYAHDKALELEMAAI